MTPDPYRYFRIEARELLDQLGKAVLDLEKGPAPTQVSRVLRFAHTLKGAARVVKQREIADSAHAIEDALAPFREQTAAVPKDRIDEMLRMLDEIAARLAALAPAAEAAGGGVARARSEEVFRTVRADVVEIDNLLDGITESHTWLGTLRKQIGGVERCKQLAEQLVGQLGAPRARAVQGGDGLANERDRLIAEELRNVHGDLARKLASDVERIDRELRQVRDTAERLRLVPAGDSFTSLERTARDTAQALGKRVVFYGRGDDVRLDAHVLAAVQGALQHVVRNAVAHGIELATERTAAGKPPEGRVVLDVVRRRHRIAFVCVDDGRGVDLEAVRRAVRSKGTFSRKERELDAKYLMSLLLKGGISTTHAVSEVSGRGIGLDVVREAAERLGGEVAMRTEPGRGTTVELVVPVSLVSLEALVMEDAGASATIPLDAVQRTLRVLPGDLTRTVGGESLVHEGNVIPFVSLSRALSRGTLPVRGARPLTAVVVRSAAGVAAVGVERLLGTMSVLLRPLSDLVPVAPVVAGASLDEGGNPQLMLDPDALVVEAGRAAGVQPEPETPGTPVLVIDDSLTTRMLERSILESAGYEVDVATSGEEALDMARRRRYALFLVDVEMPGMDGYAFIEHASADPALAGVPSILVTSRAAPEDRRRGEEVGAHAYVVKSEFDQSDLLKRIRELVG
jgi:two-component system chemotaxis sensor kinase CheA